MFITKTKIISISLFVFLTALIVLPEVSHAAGLVPCATTDNNRACTLCDFIVGIKGLVDFGTKLVTIAAIVAIFFAGVMYVISTGDEGMMTKAKGFMKSSLVGFALIFTAWLIVNVVMLTLGTAPGMNLSITNWYTFSCSTKSSQGTTPAASTTPTTGGAPASSAGGACGNSTSGNVGQCLANGNICPDGWTGLAGTCPSSSVCCTKDGAAGDKCGKYDLGKCWGGQGSTCPSGSSFLSGGADCVSNTLCCVDDAPVGGKCGDNNIGTCLGNGNICPDNWSRATGGANCVSGAVCCKQN
jgi:hypothetical protein